MNSKDIILHNKDILFYISDFLEDEDSYNFFNIKKYHHNIFKNNKHRYTIKRDNFDLEFMMKKDIYEIYKGRRPREVKDYVSAINLYHNMTNFNANPFEIIFSVDFFIDYYSSIRNDDDVFDIKVLNMDALIELYFMIYKAFGKVTRGKYNIRVVFVDEFDKVFDYVYGRDDNNDTEKFSNMKRTITITVNVENFNFG
jgi:hypothetical protein